MQCQPLSPVLRVDGLAAGYGSKRILSDVTFCINPAEILGVIGPNGAGKSTLIETITGLLRPLDGTVRIANHDPLTDPLAARRAFGLALSQELLPRFLTGQQYIEMIAAVRGVSADAFPVPDPIRRLGLSPWIDSVIGTYSLGTAMKLSICAAMLGEPPLLIFDESMNGLDPVAGYEFKQIMTELKQAGLAILLTTHSLDVVIRHCDRTLMLNDGKVEMQWSGDDMAEARSNPEAFEAAIVERLRRNRAVA